jgi:subtilisin family serine protease
MRSFLFLSFLNIALSKKIVKLNSNHNYHSLNEYRNFNDNHFLFVEDHDLDKYDNSFFHSIYDDTIMTTITPQINASYIDSYLNNFFCDINSYSWGIDRINQRELPLDCTLNHDIGSNKVTVYVVDTGIDISHPWLPNAETGKNNIFWEENTDLHGHGTHVAGIIGGLNIGVANKVNIVSVKVLSKEGSGSTTAILDAFTWILTDSKKRNTKAIINLSLGGPKTDLYDDYIEMLYLNDIIVVAAAGNDDEDACNTSPASSPLAITVGSINSIDMRSSFSNYGDCVDIFAPGNNILSTYLNHGTAKLSGTSMATPFVSGTLAYIWSNNIHLSNKEIIDILLDESTKGTIETAFISLNGSPNKLVYLTDRKDAPILYYILISIFFCFITICLCICCINCINCMKYQQNIEEEREGELNIEIIDIQNIDNNQVTLDI